jgi:transposase-like protein
MDKYKEELQQKLENENIKCPYCKSKDVGIDNWGMFEGERDWFYYCEKCDAVFK